MAAPEGYFDYPHRREGLDHDLFAMRYMKDATLDFGARPPLALWLTVDVDYFPLDMAQGPFLPSGGLSRPYPDLWNYTSREYGNRVGIYRLLDVLEKHGVRATLFVQSTICRMYPVLMRDLAASGHEIAAGSIDMGHLHIGGMDLEIERAWIVRALEELTLATGRRPRGWHSPAFSQSFATPALLAEAGLAYVCDWVNDELPYEMTTTAGSILSLPKPYELSDRKILFEQNQSLSDFQDQILSAWRWLREEAAPGRGRILSLSLSPWVLGQPYRIAALDRLLSEILADARVFDATGETLAALAAPQCFGDAS